ncbi:MAG: hypothetical protein WCG45_04720 [bacterium]
MPEKLIFNDRSKKLEEQKIKEVETLAKLMHENWRKERFDPKTSSFTPRMKKVQDKEWIQKHEGISEVDIANTPYDELPNDWKEENHLSAEVAIEKINDVLNLIHDNWLDRNDVYASDDQKAQYSRLTTSEKIKDINILEEAIKVLKGETKMDEILKGTVPTRISNVEEDQSRIGIKVQEEMEKNKKIEDLREEILKKI